MKESKFLLRSAVILGILFMFCMPSLAYSDEAVGWYDTGNMLLQSGNYTEANTAYDNAISLEPVFFEAWDHKADALNRDGQYTDALAASTRSLEINPGYVAGWINQGQILYNIGYYYEDRIGDMATADEFYARQLFSFEKAIELEPDNAEAWFNRGYALAGLKRYDEAILSFDKVKSLDPEYPKLNLSRNQAEVLRDATMPFYVRYAVPVILGIIIIIIAGTCIIIRTRKTKTEPEDNTVRGKQQTRQKKEQ